MGRSLYALGRLPQVLARLDEQLFHAVGNFNLPLTRVPGKALVLTVHDLIPVLLPETRLRGLPLAVPALARAQPALADRVICVSERTRRRSARALRGGPGARSAVVHNGVDHVDSGAPARPGERGLPAHALALAARLRALRRRARRAKERRAWCSTRCVQLKEPGQARGTLVLVGPELVRLARRRAPHRHAARRRPRRAAAGLPGRAALLRADAPRGRLRLPVALRGVRAAAARGDAAGRAGHRLQPRARSPRCAATRRRAGRPGRRGRPRRRHRPAAVASTAKSAPIRVEAGRRRAADFTWKRCAQETLEVYREALAIAG